MLIGELAKRTGTSERLLRYYERVGLLRPDRKPNGYRNYDETVLSAVLRIRALLAAGLSTRVIRQVLPCTNAEVAVLPCPGVLDTLRAQLRTLDQRSAEINAARDVLLRIITTAETAPTAAAPRASSTSAATAL
ncbi:MerR family transcriptional regulator [Yinghuangia sp. ASG 101]|uniref:MerR family transcriptional regulator n=1 Tax=Yinghuangia sp. ASG 101 TaxID=2896848 RepID=UPI001E34383E|nr:MerR family transcriptional regulator [Yinghuangia sp. ASG 101]UGQ11485.1 MerR family transcriptional regulator [Yinghuangia sp. ASG 101]